MSKKLKEYIAKDLKSKIKVDADAGFVAFDYMGLNAQEDFDLRKNLREVGGRMHVVHNRLALKALSPTLVDGSSAFATIFRGPTAVVQGGVGSDNLIAVSKVLVKWRKEHAEKITIKGGVFSGSLLDPPAVMELSNIPDKHTLFTQMAGLFQSPLRDVTVVTGQVVARVLYAINNYKEKLEKGDGEG